MKRTWLPQRTSLSKRKDPSHGGDEDTQTMGQYCEKTTRGGYYNKELARYHGRAPAPPTDTCEVNAPAYLILAWAGLTNARKAGHGILCLLSEAMPKAIECISSRSCLAKRAN